MALAEELHPTHENRDVTLNEHYTFFVTNLSETFSPQAIVVSYQQRDTMENFIKETKNGFDLDQMKSHDFLVNEARIMLTTYLSGSVH